MKWTVTADPFGLHIGGRVWPWGRISKVTLGIRNRVAFVEFDDATGLMERHQIDNDDPYALYQLERALALQSGRDANLIDPGVPFAFRPTQAVARDFGTDVLWICADWPPPAPDPRGPMQRAAEWLQDLLDGRGPKPSAPAPGDYAPVQFTEQGLTIYGQGVHWKQMQDVRHAEGDVIIDLVDGRTLYMDNVRVLRDADLDWLVGRIRLLAGGHLGGTEDAEALREEVAALKTRLD